MEEHMDELIIVKARGKNGEKFDVNAIFNYSKDCYEASIYYFDPTLSFSGTGYAGDYSYHELMEEIDGYTKDMTIIEMICE